MTVNPGRRTALEIASGAVREAARLCVDVLHEMEIDPVRKQDSSPVTVADYGSQALVCDALSRAFPADPIVAEESGSELLGLENGRVSARILRHVRSYRPGVDMDDVLRWIDLGSHGHASDRYWSLDPVDGTKGFLRGAQFAVALALVEDGRPVISCVACPRLELNGARGVLATAVRGNGAWVESLSGSGVALPLQVRNTDIPADSRYCESVEATHSSHEHAGRIAGELGILAPPIRMDSQAKYAVVASGGAEIYMRLPSGRRRFENVWDHAAGCLLVEEAGGRVTDCLGLPLDFGQGRRLSANRGVIATNGRLHESVLSAVALVESGPIGKN